MPVKNMVYDALEYAGQVRKAAASHRKAKDTKNHNTGEYLSGFYKEDRLIPVITLVIFFSAEEWDGPMSLHDMLCVQDEEILSLVENYRIHLIAPANLKDEELDKFHSSLKEVLSFIKYSTDRQQLEKLIAGNENFAAMDRKAAMVINACTNSKLKFDLSQEAAGMDMCKAIADIRNESRNEGRNEGRAEGAFNKAKETVLNLKAMGMEPEFIAKAVNEDVEIVKQWMDEGIQL